MHVLSDANGLPLLVGVTGANTHDSLALKPMIMGHQTTHDPHRGRYFKPQRLHADKAYDVPHPRKWLRGKRIGVRIARKGVESSERLGRRRWVIERTMSWLTGDRRLVVDLLARPPAVVEFGPPRRHLKEPLVLGQAVLEPAYVLVLDVAAEVGEELIDVRGVVAGRTEPSEVQHLPEDRVEPGEKVIPGPGGSCVRSRAPRRKVSCCRACSARRSSAVVVLWFCLVNSDSCRCRAAI